MYDFLKILIIFSVIIILIRLKLNIGYVLTFASALLAFLFKMSLETIINTIKQTIIDPITVKLFFALTLIRIFEIVLREKNVLAVMTESARAILKKKKAVIVSMPTLIGLLPSLGGAYFSAPMVEESTKNLRMSQEEKSFINYWFRHPWEFILPLYPGILLVSAISHLELRTLIISNIIYSLLIFITGFILSMRGIKGEVEKSHKKVNKHYSYHPYWSFIPLILVLFIVIVLGIELHYALAVTIIPLLIFYRYKIPHIVRILKHGFALEVIVLIFGVMLFKFTMENSGAVAKLSKFFTDEGLPLLPISLILPLITGLLTGITVGFVSASFPLLIALSDGAKLNLINLAFASGYIGVLLSPVHLCLVLTKEYFKADLWGIYKKIIPGCLVILICALLLYNFL
ncbi:MAG: DUF401 family protein [Thermodesulfovibrionales bacterium]|nr:DUF401 family protein [Thermodesulfovibrionales bacterium]